MQGASECQVNNNDNKNNNEIELSPNPAQDFIVLRIKNYDLISGNIKIIDFLGKETYSKVFPVSSDVTSDRTFNIDTKEFNNGIYFCLININGRVETRKFVVIK